MSDPVHFICPIADLFKKHHEEAQQMAKSIDTLHHALGPLTVNAKYIRDAADSLQAVKESANSIKDSLENSQLQLVEIASGKNQIPLVSHILTLLVIGAALLVIVIDKSGKAVHIGLDGIEIGDKSAVHQTP